MRIIAAAEDEDTGLRRMAAERPDYQELETLQPPTVEHFPNGKRTTSYKANGTVDFIDEWIYDASSIWPD